MLQKDTTVINFINRQMATKTNFISFLLLCLFATTNAQDARDNFLYGMLSNELPVESDKRNFLRHYTQLDTLYCFENMDGERSPVGRTIYSYNSNQQIDTFQLELFRSDFQRYWEEKTYVYLYDEQGRLIEEQDICLRCVNQARPFSRRTFIYSNLGTLDTVNTLYFESGDWEIDEQDIYFNDLDGKVISITTQSATGHNDKRKLFFYNNNRQVVEIHYQDFSFGEWYTEKKEKLSDYNGEIAECIIAMQNDGHEFYPSERWLLETENGQVFSIAYSDWHDEGIDAWQCDERTDFLYDTSGQLTHTESAFYTYVDLEMRLMERTQQVHIPDDQFILDSTFTEKYYLQEKGWFNDRKTYRKQTIDSQLLVKLDYRWNAKNGGWVRDSYDSIYYSQTGQILERYYDKFSYLYNQLLSSEQTTYQYDDHGNQTYTAFSERTDLQTDYVLIKADSSFFDENNLLQTTKTYDYSNQNATELTQEINYEYNDEQQLISEIHRVIREGDTLVNLIRYLYEYDTNKHLTRETYQVFIDNIWTNRRRISYEYDSDDNIIVEQVESIQFEEWVVVKVTDFIFSNQILDQSQAVFLNRFADTVWQVNLYYLYDAANQLIQINQEELRDRYDWIPFSNCIGYTQPSIVAQSRVYPVSDFCTFPNPYRRDSAIICDQLVENKPYQLRIFDLNGRLLQQQKITSNTNFYLNFSTENGVYIFQLLAENGLIYAEKVMVY